MNRRDRRAVQSRARAAGERPEQLAARAEREGYAIYQATPEHSKKLGDIQTRIFNHFDDVSCSDVFMVCLTLCSVMAVYGASNTVDQFPVRSRESFLKNCAERYDGMVARKAAYEEKKAVLQ